MSTGPLNSAAPTTSFVIGGVYNVIAPAPIPGQVSAVQLDANGNLLVNIAAGAAGGGTQYVDGVTQATPTGNVALGKNPSNILHSLSLDASGNLNVNLAAGSISGGNAAASPTGAAVPASADYLGVNIAGNLVGVTGLSLTNAKAITVGIVDASGNQITSFGGGTQYATGTAVATPTGTAALGWDGANVRVLLTDASGRLSVNINGTVPVTLASTTITGTVAVSLVSTTITGTVAVTQSTSPWVDNISQFGGSNVVTGTGVSGAGIPRVTVSSDSFPATQAVTQSGLWNVNQAIGVAGFGKITDGSNTAAVKAASTAPGATDPALVVAISPNTPTLPVSLASTTITGTVAVTQSTSPWVDNISQFGGAAVSLGAKTSANSIPVVLASDEATLPVSIAATVNVSVQNATLAVTQSTSPWVVSQSGLWNVNQAIGVAGFEKITDGVSTVAVKAASTPAVAADSALVVAISPNNSLTVSDAADGIVGNTAPSIGQLMAGRDQNAVLRAVSTDPMGQIIISPSSEIRDILYQMLLEIRASKFAQIAMATGSSSSMGASDFDPSNFQDNVVGT